MQKVGPLHNSTKETPSPNSSKSPHHPKKALHVLKHALGYIGSRGMSWGSFSWSCRRAAASSPALRNRSRINVADNLLLWHALSQSSPSDTLPLARGLFLTVAKKLVRMG